MGDEFRKNPTPFLIGGGIAIAGLIFFVFRRDEPVFEPGQQMPILPPQQPGGMAQDPGYMDMITQLEERQIERLGLVAEGLQEGFMEGIEGIHERIEGQYGDLGEELTAIRERFDMQEADIEQHRDEAARPADMSPAPDTPQADQFEQWERDDNLIQRLQDDIQRVTARRDDPAARAYFDRAWGGIDGYLASQRERLVRAGGVPTPIDTATPAARQPAPAARQPAPAARQPAPAARQPAPAAVRTPAEQARIRAEAAQTVAIDRARFDAPATRQPAPAERQPAPATRQPAPAARQPAVRPPTPATVVREMDRQRIGTIQPVRPAQQQTIQPQRDRNVPIPIPVTPRVEVRPTPTPARPAPITPPRVTTPARPAIITTPRATTPAIRGIPTIPRLPAPAAVPRIAAPAAVPRIAAPAAVPRIAAPAAVRRIAAPTAIPRPAATPTIAVLPRRILDAGMNMLGQRRVID